MLVDKRGRGRNWSSYAIAILVLALPLGAQALGLGEARVESYLNQPLDVRMRLLDASETDLDTLTVGPASPEDFERLGMTSSSLALNLDISVDRTQSPPVIHVTSDRPVTDPVVQLLIDARWSNGRMLREYTLFLDPPTVDIEPPAAQPSREIAEPEAREPEPAPEPDRPRPAPAADAPSERASAVSGARRYGPVAGGETLWSIASENLPSDDVTMDQMMMAIVDLNPAAFRDRNINRLLRGAELELPSARQARAMSAEEAAAAVAAQNRAFQRLAASRPSRVSDAGRDMDDPAGTEAAAAGETAADGGEDDVDHRLSLVPPGDEEGGAGTADGEAEIESLRQRLARAEEELYAARQEADDFRNRVEELESVVRENPGGLGIRDAELAGLEETLRAAREATREDADPELRAEVSERLSDYLERYTAGPEDASAEDAPAMPERDAEFAAAAESAEDRVADAEDDARDATATAGEESPQATADESGAAADARDDGADEQQTTSERTVTEVGGDSGSWWSNPIVLVVIGLVILLAIAGGLGMAVRRRRQEAAERERPLKRAADLSESEASTKTPAEEARERVAAQPEDLGAHLALLKTLATEGREQEFGDALEAMFEHVDSGDEPEWREALDLAGRIVPGHALVKGSADWVAESEDAEERGEPSEIDEETEVDDLMSRLDAESESEDESEWLGEKGEADEEDQQEKVGPLLREPGFAAGGSEAERPEQEDAEGADAGHRDKASTEATEREEAGDEDELSAEDEARRDESDDLVLDWPDLDSETDEQAGLGGGEEVTAQDEKTDEGDDTDDIFSQSDDDIDVKLDLAKAYLSWNSADSARTLLQEVAREGNESQRAEAQKLLDELSDDSES